MEKLKETLRRIDGHGYKSYKQLKGSYNFANHILLIDHVQGDPFASPSKLRIRVQQNRAGFDKSLFSNHSRLTALEDYICRQFSLAIKKISGGIRGTGKSGLIYIDAGGQEILERTAVYVDEEFVEARFYVGLPARGRTVMGRQCEKILTVDIPEIAASSLFYRSLDPEEILDFINISEDQDILRKQLKERKLVSFIRNGSILPRRSGISDSPLLSSETIRFRSPAELEVTMDTLHSGSITGMGIPEGITLIIGGGFHGKSTLLSSIERGIYNHIPGDGREYVVTLNKAVKIRAEEGRSIQKVNISPFITNLPMNKDTVKFSTANASGSTSQAANIIEALECRAEFLLLDEDTSATNFLIRDEIMQKTVPKEKEPITPFIDCVKNIYREFGTSSILVMGGSGDYFEVADTVIMMDNYLPILITEKAKQIINSRKDIRKIESPGYFGKLTERIPVPESIDPYRGKRIKVKSRGTVKISFGNLDIDLTAVEQIVDKSQVNAISGIILYGLRKGYIDGRNTLMEILDNIFKDIDKNGLEIISEHSDGHPGSYAIPRKFEVACAINRLRSLKVIQL
jgi:predicted ABC-class ATPase